MKVCILLPESLRCQIIIYSGDVLPDNKCSAAILSAYDN